MVKLFPKILLLSAVALAGCSDAPEDKIDNTPPKKVEDLYNEAQSLFKEKSYSLAVEKFGEVEQLYPYSPWAKHAMVMSGYTSYKAEKFDEAITTLERFIRLYPDNESTPYAYYLIALSHYEQISDVGRDQKKTQDALAALREVVRRFPDTDYARDATIKIDLTIDHLAGKEMEIGRYYLGRMEYLAAINRFRVVVENYETTTHIPEALHRLVECYQRLGVTQEAQRYAAVLGHNYPSSLWYRDSYALMKGAVPSQAATSNKTTSNAPSSWWDSVIP